MEYPDRSCMMDIGRSVAEVAEIIGETIGVKHNNNVVTGKLFVTGGKGIIGE